MFQLRHLLFCGVAKCGQIIVIFLPRSGCSSLLSWSFMSSRFGGMLGAAAGHCRAGPAPPAYSQPSLSPGKPSTPFHPSQSSTRPQKRYDLSAKGQEKVHKPIWCSAHWNCGQGTHVGVLCRARPAAGSGMEARARWREKGIWGHEAARKGEGKAQSS